MNIHKIKALIYLTIGFIAGGTLLTSCELEPYEIPAEEMFLRNFIKKYGLIDPAQDWNLSQESTVSIIPVGEIDRINVLVEYAGDYYRVAEYRYVDEPVTIPLDIPDGIDRLYVDIDGKIYPTTLGGTVVMDKASSRSGESRADDPAVLYKDLGWLMVAEDLGATDDFDFNDIIVRIEAVSVNFKANIAPTDWQEVNQDEWVDISQPSAAPRKSRAGTTAEDATYKRIRVTAMCAGGTLPLYLHYFENNTDYIISKEAGICHPVALTDESEGYEIHEWHRWFGVKNYRTMINTGSSRDHSVTTTKVIDHFEPVEFYVGPTFSMNNYSKFIDYDGNKNSLHPTEPTNPDWNWANTPTNYIIEGFYITVGGATLASCQSAVYQPKRGEAPQAFLIPDVGSRTYGWEWPTERTDITTVYPHFLDWAKAGGQTTDDNALFWYTKADNSLTPDYDYCSREGI